MYQLADQKNATAKPRLTRYQLHMYGIYTTSVYILHTLLYSISLKRKSHPLATRPYQESRNSKHKRTLSQFLNSPDVSVASVFAEVKWPVKDSTPGYLSTQCR